MHAEGYVKEPFSVRKMFNSQQFLSRLVIYFGEHFRQFPSYHERNQLIVIQVSSQVPSYQLSISEDRNLICYLKHFRHLMCNINNGHALFLQHSYDVKKAFHFLVCNCRCRLIHYDQLGMK